APAQLTKIDLINRYGNYNACRKVAKQVGITFRKSPRWPQLVAAFNYLESCQACIDSYLQCYPNPELKGVSVVIKLGN
ncbi:MAG: serine/threonine protein kinase, partial [Cyanobacteria bacterium J06635_15]